MLINHFRTCLRRKGSYLRFPEQITSGKMLTRSTHFSIITFMFRVISHESSMQIHLVDHFSNIVKKTTEKLVLFS